MKITIEISDDWLYQLEGAADLRKEDRPLSPVSQLVIAVVEIAKHQRETKIFSESSRKVNE